MSEGEPGTVSEMDVDRPDPQVGQTPGAPDDEEMPLTDHIEEMVNRLAKVVLALTVVAVVAFPFADWLINFLWYSILPGDPSMCPSPVDATAGVGDAACPRLYHPLALILARLKVASLVGFVAALPVFVYQTYLFMRPGLYPSERKYYLAAVPTSLVLAGVGVAFAFLLILPAIFTYFLYYSEEAAVIAFGLQETFNLMVMMLGLFALVFQIPLFVMLAIMMGVTSRRWLETRRLYFWGGFATIAFLFAPDPTGMAPIMVALTMIALFEATLRLVRWTGEDSLVPTAEGIRDVRPHAWVLAGLAGYVASGYPFPDGYYDDLPAVVTDALASWGMVDAVPFLVASTIIVAYELALRQLKRAGVRYMTRLKVKRFRRLVWFGAAVLGYFASPPPVLVELLDQAYLTDVAAAGLAVGLIVAYELTLLGWRVRERR